MAHTTLASTDRALEKIGDFVAVQGRRCGCTSAAGGLDLRGLYDHLRHKARFDGNGLHRTVLGALAERLAAAPGIESDYLVQALENDFPHLMERQREIAWLIVFKEADNDDSGLITYDELRTVCRRHGRPATARPPRDLRPRRDLVAR